MMILLVLFYLLFIVDEVPLHYCYWTGETYRWLRRDCYYSIRYWLLWWCDDDSKIPKIVLILSVIETGALPEGICSVMKNKSIKQVFDYMLEVTSMWRAFEVFPNFIIYCKGKARW